MEGARALGILGDEGGSTRGYGSLCVPGTGQKEPGRELTHPINDGKSYSKRRPGWAVPGGPAETALSLRLVGDEKGLL